MVPDFARKTKKKEKKEKLTQTRIQNFSPFSMVEANIEQIMINLFVTIFKINLREEASVNAFLVKVLI